MKKYFGKVELDMENATVTLWEINVDQENNHLVCVWDIAGTPGWSWGFSVDGKDVVVCKKGDKGYAEIYSICDITGRQAKSYHSRVLDVAIATGFLQV